MSYHHGEQPSGWEGYPPGPAYPSQPWHQPQIQPSYQTPQNYWPAPAPDQLYRGPQPSHPPTPPMYQQPAYSPPTPRQSLSSVESSETRGHGKHRRHHSRHDSHRNPSPQPHSSPQPQSHGPGARTGHQPQHHTRSGRRKALLIGINYFGQRGQLKGCINDVANMSRFLSERYGYAREDMVTLTDDQQNPIGQPTKQNILRAMSWLVKDAQPGDSLFFHFSGHGGQTADLDGDEDDGYDEVIYPVDFKVAGHIVDDDMHRIMVSRLPAGVRLTAIFDSCHSGTALDLPYVYSTQGVVKEQNIVKEAAVDLFGAVSAYQQGDIKGAASTAIGFFKKVAIGDRAREKTLRTKASPADVVMLAASKDKQTSRDTWEDGSATGAMSWAFIKVLKQSPHQTYLELLNSLRVALNEKYTQKPQLSCSHELNVNKPFTL